MDNEINSLQLSRIKVTLFSTLYISLFIMLVSSEFINAMFNNRFDSLETGISLRIAAAFKPTVMALYLIFTSILSFLVSRLLNPLFYYHKMKSAKNELNEDEINQARKAAVKMPRTILLFEVMVWLIGTTVYYAMKHWNAESGIPYAIGLLLKVASGYMGGLYTVFFINLIVLPLKKGLEIDSIKEGEKDFFARNKDIFAITGASFYVLVNSIYLIYYYSRSVIIISGNELIYSLVPVVSFLFLISLGPLLLSKREYRLQVKSLQKQLRSLAMSDSSELDSVFLVNFDELGDLILVTNAVVDRFRRILEKVGSTADDMSRSSRILNETSHETALSSNEQAAAVAEIVATMEDSDRLSKGIENLAVEVENKSLKNREIVDAGVNSLKEYMSTMDSLKESNLKSQEFIQSLNENVKTIMDVSNIIKSIADQVKIIAFNAELEAAAAGDAGKNFEIVASEVRRLADNTVNAATEIRKKINVIEKKSSGLFEASEETTMLVDKGWDMSRETEDIFNEILSSSHETSHSAQSIANNIQLQIQGFAQILDSMKQISGTVHQFSEATQSSHKTAADLDKFILILKEALK